MNESALCEHTWQLPESVAPVGKSTDETVRYLLEAECLRRLARYRHTDILLTRKYGMSFDEFVRNSVTREKGYSWESESDAMSWETAIGGMRTVEKHLGELRGKKALDKTEHLLAEMFVKNGETDL